MRSSAAPAMCWRLLLVMAVAATLACGVSQKPAYVVVATTTSVANSGLLDVLLPRFEQRGGTSVRVLQVGSGLALQMLARGDADVVISHAPAAESAAVSQHPGWWYRKVMFNDFLLVGPRDDPARVKGSGTIEEAMRRIAQTGVTFLSRGDRSGTHERELDLWTRAGAQPSDAHRPTTGTGMGATLRVASQQSAYTLTDRATYLQLAGGLDLIHVFEGGPHLLNTYAVIANQGRATAPHAIEFAQWLSDGEGRKVIAEFRGRGGVPLFHLWPADRSRSNPADLPF